MAINLSRNTKMYISTVKTGFAAADTWEVPVLDGYSFSQDVETQNITLSEAACTPTRGQKIFNTALNPVEVSFPTYMKPFHAGASVIDAVERVIWEAFVGPGDGSNGITANGDNAVASTNGMDVTFARSNVHELLKINIIFVMDNSAYMIEDVGVNSVEVDFAIDAIAMLSWSGQGAKITSIDKATVIDMWVPGVDYTAEGVNAQAPQFIKNKLSQVEVYADTKVAFNGFQVINYGGKLVGATATTIPAGDYEFNITVDGGAEEEISITATGNETISALVTLIEAQLDLATNTDLATCSLNDEGNLSITSDNISVVTEDNTSISLNETGVTTQGLFTAIGTYYADATFLGIANAQPGLEAGKQYLIPITGGSMTLTNNVTYLTPEELGKVNQPIPGGFTGTREFGGTLNAYLNTGSNRSGGLLDDLTTDAALAESTNRFYINIAIGGCSASPKVEFTIPSAHLVIPTTSVEDVISTEIGFTAISTDLNLADEISVKYTATV